MSDFSSIILGMVVGTAYCILGIIVGATVYRQRDKYSWRNLTANMRVFVKEMGTIRYFIYLYTWPIQIVVGWIQSRVPPPSKQAEYKKTDEELEAYDQFEECVTRVLGDEINAEVSFAEQFWVALANKSWYHENGKEVFYTFRSAGSLIAGIRGGDYMEWYCCRDDREPVLERITDAMKAEGWTWKPMR